MTKYISEDGEVLDTNCEDCGPVFFKTPYNHDRDEEVRLTSLTCTDPSLTDQSFKDDVDINTIVDRLMKTGEVNIPLPEHFGDQSEIPSLYEAAQRIAENNATFYKLSPKIRNEFMNDPLRWAAQVDLDLAQGNVENLQRMGIDIHLKPPAAPQAGTPAPGAPETPEGASKPPTGATDPASGVSKHI